MIKLKNRLVLNLIDSYESYSEGGELEQQEQIAGDILDGEITKTYSHFCDVTLKSGKIAVGIPQRFLEKIS